MADIFGKDKEIMLFQTDLETKKKTHIMTLKYISNQTMAVYLRSAPMRHLVRRYRDRYIFQSRKMHLEFDKDHVLVYVKGVKTLNGIYKTTHRRREGILDKGLMGLFK